jgi:signal transduction histidine kinase
MRDYICFNEYCPEGDFRAGSRADTHEIRGGIFDPFFTTKAMGQGRGLDIARRLVRPMGGQIDVASRSGWTEFQVSLPIAR